MLKKPKPSEGNDRDIQAALAALAEAQTRAKASGRPVTLVQGTQLVRVSGDKTEVVKEVRARRSVSSRVKRSGQ